MRKNQVTCVHVASWKRSLLIDISIICYTTTWQLSIRVVGYFLCYLWSGANHKIRKAIFDGILNIFRVVNELIGRSGQSSHFSWYFTSKIDGLITDGFKSNLVIRNNGDISTKRFLLDKLLGYNLIFYNNIEQSTSSSYFQCFLMYFFFDSK